MLQTNSAMRTLSTVKPTPEYASRTRPLTVDIDLLLSDNSKPFHTPKILPWSTLLFVDRHNKIFTPRMPAEGSVWSALFWISSTTVVCGCSILLQKSRQTALAKQDLHNAHIHISCRSPCLIMMTVLVRKDRPLRFVTVILFDSGRR